MVGPNPSVSWGMFNGGGYLLSSCLDLGDLWSSLTSMSISKAEPVSVELLPKSVVSRGQRCISCGPTRPTAEMDNVS